MKKNAILTFLCACVPGAGQMYYGYMQRGLSLITLFCGAFFLGWIAEPLSVTMAIVWMYSVCYTDELVPKMAAGAPKEHGRLLLGDVEAFKRLIPQHNKLLGWGLVALGVYSLYNSVLRPLLIDLLDWMGIDNAWRILNNIPTVVVAALLIGAGLWLLGLHPAQKPEELPPYPHNDEEV